jgi:hypothetical protein
MESGINMTRTYSQRPDANGQMLLTGNIQFSIFLSQEWMGVNLPPQRDHLKLTYRRDYGQKR